ncbi:SDR family oxidoreductase [Vibrio sp. YMD68]|uniref:SDR family oxidoreductase n=1 Tax=Vibrio sp. YMD68 TaxID=3042300 RepID=UPI00249A951A|nr:SDR family oxidoreductase [Vibrio sp. YMD68]WGV98293.1 SDR family oxidoreductase [Vibrio sp. YMD68]
MTHSSRILVVGATGYLGLHMVRQLQTHNLSFKAIARNKKKLVEMGVSSDQIIEAQVTDPKSLLGELNEIDVVISCLGITRQKDGLKYMDVDYQANLNVLIEAERSGVSRFIYISAFNAQKYRNIRLLQAKEQFAQRLLNSKILAPCVIRPNGFFSDLEEIYHMAASGRVYLFGSRTIRLNPIHGSDLATFCIDAVRSTDRELEVGGPETLTTVDIAQQAFKAQNKEANIVLIPDTIRRIALWLMKKLPEKWGGSGEFFLTALGGDAIAPQYGTHKLSNHYVQMFTNKD